MDTLDNEKDKDHKEEITLADEAKVIPSETEQEKALAVTEMLSDESVEDTPAVALTDHSSSSEHAESLEKSEDSSEGAKTSSEKPQKAKEGLAQEREKFLEQFHQVMEGTPDPTVKLQRAIDFMETSLSQKGTPHFKNFWEARRLCLELFRDSSINPVVRSTLWNKQIELSEEARRLKKMLDEQSAFAVEQIEIAVKGLENDLERLEEVVIAAPDVALPASVKTLEKSSYDYQSSLKPLGILNTFAERTNSLRKELIRTEMRIRTKNGFFQRLSSAGDKIFPKRKALIKGISDAYQKDVESFLKQCQKKEVVLKNLRGFREEVKGLQSAAKALSLNTRIFSETRKKLSECWDLVRDLEKERRKERSHELEELRQKAGEIQQQIKEIAKQFSDGELNAKSADDKLSTIYSEMRKMHLGRHEITLLKEAIQIAKKPIQERLDTERAEREKKAKELKQAQEEAKQVLREQLLQLTENKTSTEEMRTTIEEVSKKIKDQKLSYGEKLSFDCAIKDAQEKVAFLEKETALKRSDDPKITAKSLLKEWKAWKKTVRDDLETLRKSQGSSGLDFETAMIHREVTDAERQRLQRITEVIDELQKNLSAS